MRKMFVSMSVVAAAAALAVPAAFAGQGTPPTGGPGNAVIVPVNKGTCGNPAPDNAQTPPNGFPASAATVVFPGPC